MVKNRNTTDQGQNVRHGFQAGYNNQGTNAIAVGAFAGQTSQSNQSVAIGVGAAARDQKQSSIAIGINAASINQSEESVAIGVSAGYLSQGSSSIAIGTGAGYNSAGDYSIAIGHKAGFTTQNTQTIVLNATGGELNTSNTGAFYVKPIRFLDTLNANVLTYIPETGEIVDSNAITFRAGSTLVGISNSNPSNMLDVGNRISVHSDGDTVLTVHGDMSAGKLSLTEDLVIAGKLSLSKDLVIAGNLHVHGKETIMNTEKILVEDPIIGLGHGNNGTIKTLGLLMETGQTSNVFAGYKDSKYQIGYTTADIHANSVTLTDISTKINGSLETGSITGNGSGLTGLNASNITSGTINNNYLPSIISGKTFTGNGSGLTGLNASNITSGKIANNYLPSIISGKTFTGDGSGLTGLNASNITSGTIETARIPNLDASKITTGKIASDSLPDDIMLKNNKLERLHESAPREKGENWDRSGFDSKHIYCIPIPENNKIYLNDGEVRYAFDNRDSNTTMLIKNPTAAKIVTVKVDSGGGNHIVNGIKTTSGIPYEETIEIPFFGFLIITFENDGAFAYVNYKTSGFTNYYLSLWQGTSQLYNSEIDASTVIAELIAGAHRK